MPRIAVGSLFIECNHFGGPVADLETFRRSELRYGEDIISNATGTMAGMISVLRARGETIVPLLQASACPSGVVAADCYTALKTDLLRRLRNEFPVDGVLLALHGAAAAENAGDLEGDLIQAVRDAVGPDIPIIATLDLHAHVTPTMVENANGLVAWETYPHRDAFSTGERGARLLGQILDGTANPTMVLAKVPVIVSAIHGNTEGEGPFADVMRQTKSLEQENDVLSTSLFLVHPNLDLPGMGGGAVVITNDNVSLAETLACELAMSYWNRRFDLEPDLIAPDEAILRADNIDGGPVLLVEAADCCGGGAAGDSVASLNALLNAELTGPAFVPVVDPVVAEACHANGLNSTITVDVGHRLDPRWGSSVTITGKIVALTNGEFTYTGGIWDGQQGHMGRTALLEIGSIHLMVASHPTYDWNKEQFESVGFDVRKAKYIVVKNPMNFNMAYAGIAKAHFILDTPGPTPATMRYTTFTNVDRPCFPQDQDIPGLEPAVYRSRPSG
ncbi:MAG: M81 family metallopeptidase [Planctomycetota bacterium]|nr:M81 family metallopeptidase [Planctomycetota bacterium]MDA1214870.1 M81 family metallopeptidase [Planctomycetota bacterium]